MLQAMLSASPIGYMSSEGRRAISSSTRTRRSGIHGELRDEPPVPRPQSAPCGGLVNSERCRMDDNDRGDSMEWMFRGGVAWLALGAFCVQPLLPLVEPIWFLNGGLALGLGCAFFLTSYGNDARTMRSDWSSGAIIIVGLVILTSVVTKAEARSEANKKRCILIERDMLSANPALANGPDIFQALGCRPQTGILPDIVRKPIDLPKSSGTPASSDPTAAPSSTAPSRS